MNIAFLKETAKIYAYETEKQHRAQVVFGLWNRRVTLCYIYGERHE